MPLLWIQNQYPDLLPWWFDFAFDFVATWDIRQTVHVYTSVLPSRRETEMDSKDLKCLQLGRLEKNIRFELL